MISHDKPTHGPAHSGYSKVPLARGSEESIIRAPGSGPSEVRPFPFKLSCGLNVGRTGVPILGQEKYQASMHRHHAEDCLAALPPEVKQNDERHALYSCSPGLLLHG